MDYRALVHPGLSVSPFDVGLARQDGERLLFVWPEDRLPETVSYQEELRQLSGMTVALDTPPRGEPFIHAMRERIGGVGSARVIGMLGRGNGATTFTIHLARALAGSGLKVALLDADLRHLGLFPALQISGAPAVFNQLIVPRFGSGLRAVSLGAFTPDVHSLPFRGPALDRLLETYRLDVLWGRPDVLLVDLPDLPDVLVPLVEGLGVSEVVRLLGPLEEEADLPLEVPVSLFLRSPGEKLPEDVGLKTGGRAGTAYLAGVQEAAAALFSKGPPTKGSP